MIALLNRYADIIFFALYLVVLGAFALHFVGNILTGRAYKRFVLWQWPAHEEIIPPAPKIMHAVHVICMVFLAFSGFLIRFPITDRTPFRYIHYVAMYVVGVNFILRVYYAFIRDKKEFTLTFQDIKAMPATIKYYAFLASDKPHLAKYNPMQKMTYGIFFPLLMIVQGLTGLSLVWPKTFLFIFQPLVGFSGAVAYARLIHYIVAWLFIILTTVHVYLASTEGFSALLDFFGIVPAEHGAHGEHREHGVSEHATYEESHLPEKPVILEEHFEPGLGEVHLPETPREGDYEGTSSEGGFPSYPSEPPKPSEPPHSEDEI